MKKRNFLYSALALGLMGSFASCSSEDSDLGGGGSIGAGDQVIKIAVDNANSLTTRSGRPLTSEEPGQKVDEVAVIVTDDAVTGENNVVFAKVVDNWMGDGAVSEGYGDGKYDSEQENGRQYELTIPKTGTAYTLVAGKTYTVYAIGYSDNSEYSTDGTTTLSNYFKAFETGTNKTFNKNLALQFVSTKTNKAIAEEIFAGSASTGQIPADGKIAKEVVLHRQVAGIYTYVQQVPYAKDASGNVGNYLRVTASASNDRLVLGNFLPATELGGNGNNKSNNVVNGYLSTGVAASTVLYSIDLSKWYTNLVDTDGDLIIDGGTNWISSENRTVYSKKDGYGFTKGSVYGGEFIIPFLHNGTNQTLKLELVYAANAEGVATASTIRSWNIKLPEPTGYNAFVTFYNTAKVGGADFDTPTSEENKEKSDVAYSILRNHLYGVGERPENNPGTPEDPDIDPDPEDPDNPQPLKNTQDLILRVNDNWEVIHHMVIE